MHNRQCTTRCESCARLKRNRDAAERAEAWGKANPAARNTIRKRHRSKKGEHYRAAGRAHDKARRERNSERFRCGRKLAEQRRRARRVQAPVADPITPENWLARLALFSGFCAYCDQPAEQMDHVIPLRRGGAHDIFNVVPACKSCNSSKGSKDPLEWALQCYE